MHGLDLLSFAGDDLGAAASPKRERQIPQTAYRVY
jgi:hypothetical protein